MGYAVLVGIQVAPQAIDIFHVMNFSNDLVSRIDGVDSTGIPIAVLV